MWTEKKLFASQGKFETVFDEKILLEGYWEDFWSKIKASFSTGRLFGPVDNNGKQHKLLTRKQQ